MVQPSKEHLEKHYEDLKEKPFFPGLIACKSLSNPTSDQLRHYRSQQLSHALTRSRHELRPHLRHGLGGP